MQENLINLFNSFEFQTVFKLILGMILSGIIGLERESWNKPAGFRTHTLVGISAVLIMMCGEYLAEKNGNGDPSRIPAQLLSGIGFIGAGTILRDGFNVKGLTTAASLLSVTCIGLSIGAGFYIGSIVATFIVYIILSYSHVISDKVDHYTEFEFFINIENPKNHIKKIQEKLKKYNIVIKTLRTEADTIILSGKFSGDIDKNQIITDIISIKEVRQVMEN